MDSAAHRESFEQAAALIEQADALLIGAGAGMGVDSGLPDFRGKEGFWKAYPALAQSDIEFWRIASPATFRSDPALAWGFYGHRLQLYRATVPHAGFQILNDWCQAAPLGSAVFTSNVDGHFQRAGFAPDWIEECHGSIHHLQCLDQCHPGIWPADDFAPDIDVALCRLRNEAPRCPRCGGLARPNVFMFYDDEWIESRQRVQAARLERWLRDVSRPVVIEIGAGSAIPSVRQFSHRILHEFGGRMIRINPREWAVPTSLDVGIGLGALAGLQGIADALAGSTWSAP